MIGLDPSETEMAEQAEVRFLILWENEIRAAARAFAEAHRLQDDDSATDDARHIAVAKALRLANAALYGADDESATLVLSKPNDILRKRPNNQVERP